LVTLEQAVVHVAGRSLVHWMLPSATATPTTRPRPSALTAPTTTVEPDATGALTPADAAKTLVDQCRAPVAVEYDDTVARPRLPAAWLVTTTESPRTIGAGFDPVGTEIDRSACNDPTVPGVSVDSDGLS
jgi:hypothetical protein